MSSGYNSSESNSRPLSATERDSIYQAALGNLSSNIPSTGYTAPSYASPGAAKTMSDGDYAALEQNILKSRMAPINSAMADERARSDQSLSDRGLWASGIAEKAQQDVTKNFMPSITQAGADAATQRYGMQASELAGLNQFAQTSAQAQNAFDMENASRKDNSNWRPADYLAGLWNGTGGTVGSSGSEGFQF